MAEATDSLPRFQQKNSSLTKNRNVPQETPQEKQKRIFEEKFQKLLSSFQLMDTSEDMRYIALIDEDFTLHVCEITWDKKVIKPKHNTYWSRDISIHNQQNTSNQEPQHGDTTPHHESCVHPVYTFLSVSSSKPVTVAVSFAQLDAESGLFLEGMHDPNYKKCGLYKGNGQNDATYCDFQGRAAFTKDGLALVGNQKLTMLDSKTFEQKYTLDLSEITSVPEAISFAKYVAKSMTWAKFYPVREKARNESQTRKDGDLLIALTQHIKHGVLVATYKDHITEMYSIRDRSIVLSFNTIDGEHVAAISNDERYFATYNDKTEKLIVYLKEGALPLHNYTRKLAEKESKNENDESISFVNFDNLQHFIYYT